MQIQPLHTVLHPALEIRRFRRQLHGEKTTFRLAELLDWHHMAHRPLQRKLVLYGVALSYCKSCKLYDSIKVSSFVTTCVSKRLVNELFLSNRHTHWSIGRVRWLYCLLLIGIYERYALESENWCAHSLSCNGAGRK